MSVVEDEIISALLEFDFEETDAFLYLALLKMGPTTVNSLSMKIDMEKTKVYRSLHKMQSLGIITTTFSNPTLCSAVDPKTSLSRIIQKKSEQVLAMKKLLDKILVDVTRLERRNEEKPQLSSFFIIQGRTNIYTRIGKMIQDSTNTVYIVTPFFDVRRMSFTAIPDKIKEYTERYGEVVLITGNAGVGEEIEVTLNVPEIRTTKLPSNGRIVVSKDSLIMSGNINDSKRLNDDTDTAFYTNSSGIIDSVLRLCKHLREGSTAVNSLKQQNGPNLKSAKIQRA